MMKLLQTKEPINSSAVESGFEELALPTPSRWYTCTETCWRSSLNVCNNLRICITL